MTRPSRRLLDDRCRALRNLVLGDVGISVRRALAEMRPLDTSGVAVAPVLEDEVALVGERTFEPGNEIVRTGGARPRREDMVCFGLVHVEGTTRSHAIVPLTLTLRHCGTLTIGSR